MTGKKVRVVIVDDTRTIRSMIRVLLARSPDIEVVGEAGDPYEARQLIRSLNPDVITLDVVMPRMNGLEFLEKLMRLRPMPVVMVSSRTTEKSYEAVRALAIGAVDCVDLGSLREGSSQIDLADMVVMAAQSKRPQPNGGARALTGPSDFRWNGKTVLIGSSTGGVEALTEVLSSYPDDGPPTVIAQHMPATFLESFAERLDRTIAPKTCLAEGNETVEKGRVYLAPGGKDHVTLTNDYPPQLRLVNDAGEDYVPSVNLLMASGAPLGRKAVGVMLTGMGRDGAESLLKMREAGAHTIVQSGETCVVDGMPGSARKIGAAVEVAPLDQIGHRILRSTSLEKKEAL
jgi:two-component system chemotaxis response regulator CheB